MTIKLNHDQKIPTYLFDRKQGQVYDTYYRAFEEYDKRVIGSTLWNDIVNSPFISLMTDEQLLSYGAFYFVAKPADMSLSDYRNFMLLLNNVIIDGPTIDNVERVIRFFDVTATITQAATDAIYNEDYRQEIDKGNVGSNITTTSAFYNTTTHLMPTTEYVILSDDSAFNIVPGEATQLTLLDESSILYETSVLNITDMGKRLILRDVLRKILPATVRVLLNFTALIEVTFYDGSAPQNGVWSWDEDTEEILYTNTLQNYNAVVSKLVPFVHKEFDAAADVFIAGSTKHTTMLFNTGTPSLALSYCPDTVDGYTYMTSAGSHVIYWGSKVNPILLDPTDVLECHTTLDIVSSSTTSAYNRVVAVVPTARNNRVWVVTRSTVLLDGMFSFGFSVYDEFGTFERSGIYSATPAIADTIWSACVASFNPVNGTKVVATATDKSVVSIDLTSTTLDNPVAVVTIGTPFSGESMVTNENVPYDIRELFVLATTGDTHIKSVSFAQAVTDWGNITLADAWSVKLFLIENTLYIFNINQNKITRVDNLRTAPTLTVYSLPIAPISVMVPVVSRQYTKLMV